jgi:hypothetical protein
VGNAQGSHRVSLKVNGTELQSRDVELPPGSEKPLEFKLRLAGVGTYIIELDGIARTVKVIPPPEQPTGFPAHYIVIAVILVSLIAVLALYMVRRKR